jgi:2-oxoisovalerate dehydrogenase E1 component alpha subunit
MHKSANSGTQAPQAAGTGYVYRTSNENKVAACFVGEGAACEGDFPSSLNFAATLRCQTLFLCRNNQYAISTHISDQYASDGIIPRAIGIGVASTRVDGNDALACLVATRHARKYILEHRKPYFIEYVTYRVGDHSTSDNSTLYRKEEEKKHWVEVNNPIKRLFKLLVDQKYKDTPNEAQ